MFKQMSFAISRKHSDTTVRPNKIKKRNVSCAISHRAPRVTADLHGLASKSFLHVLFKVSLEGDIWFHINTLSNKTICEHEPRCLSLSPRACTPPTPSFSCQLSLPGNCSTLALSGKPQRASSEEEFAFRGVIVYGNGPGELPLC